MFLISSENIDFTRQENENTDELAENLNFSIELGLVRVAKFFEKRFRSKEKNTHPILALVSLEKISVRSVQ